MNEVDFLNEFNGKFTELSKLIKSWNLIKVTSRSEFDTLTEKILNKLYEGQSEIKIKQIIESELCVTYGLYKTEFDSNQLTQEVMAWWNE
jgi:hypothetical protein